MNSHWASALKRLTNDFDKHQRQHVLADSPVDECSFCRLEESITLFKDPAQRQLLWHHYQNFTDSIMEVTRK